MNVLEFRSMVEPKWSEKTSVREDWVMDNPALGQDVATSLLALDYFKEAQLQMGTAYAGNKAYSHYWISLNGVPVDLTWGQYPVGTKLVGNYMGVKSDLTFDPSWARAYNNLKDKVATCDYDYGDQVVLTTKPTIVYPVRRSAYKLALVVE